LNRLAGCIDRGLDVSRDALEQVGRYAQDLQAVDTTLKPSDPWNDDPKEKDDHQRVYSFWDKLDETKKAHFEVVGLIKYENIVDIDPEGDIYARCPHVYLRRVNEKGFCEGQLSYKLTASNRWGQDMHLPADADKVRVKIFPDEFPDPKPGNNSPQFEAKAVEGKETKNNQPKQ